MSGGMEDAARLEAEEAELEAMREAVAPNGRVYIAPTDPLQTQVGGSHYKSFKIQPIEFAIANKLDFFQKDILKYITRRKGDKAKRIEDLGKARHYIDLYIRAINKGDIE